MTETTETTTPETSPEEEWAAKQEAARIAQNLPEGAVPEQRPQAFAVPDPNAQHSALHDRLEEEGALPDTEPMGFDAYEKAASDSQMKKAAKESKTPRLLNGTRVQVIDEESPHRGRNGVIMETNFADDQAAADAASGQPSRSMFAEVDSYVVRTRDSRNDLIEVTPDQIAEHGLSEGWARGE